MTIEGPTKAANVLNGKERPSESAASLAEFLEKCGAAPPVAQPR